MITKKDGIAHLSTVPLFSGLSQKDLGKIFDQARVVTYEPGVPIITEGESGYAFHFIIEGRAAVERGSRKVAELGPGDFFGEMSFIDDQPRTATISGVTPVTTLVLGGWELRPIVNSNPALAWKLIVHLTERLRQEQSARDAALA